MISTAIISEVGPRQENEDCAAVWDVPSQAIGVAIADGLGGHFGGKLAANLAVDLVRTATIAARLVNLEDIALEAHHAILQQQYEHKMMSEMATTLSAAIISQYTLHAVHCGDTRICVSRRNGIKRLTRDHTELQRLLETLRTDKGSA